MGFIFQTITLKETKCHLEMVQTCKEEDAGKVFSGLGDKRASVILCSDKMGNHKKQIEHLLFSPLRLSFLYKAKF